MMVCGCDPGQNACEVAQSLFREWRQAEEAERELFLMTIEGENATDVVLYQRWEIATDRKRKALRRYQRHIDGEDVLRVVPDNVEHLRPAS